MARCTGLALWLVVASGALDAGTTVIQYDDFSNLAGITLNGPAASINPCLYNGQYVLRLTDALSQTSSAFQSAPVPLTDQNGFQGSFSTYFAFQLANPMGIGDEDGTGADGFCFVVQPISNQQLGNAGGAFGYGGINNSLAIEFDTYNNGEWDPNGNHIGVDTNGGLTSLATANVPVRLNDGGIWHAWVDYNGATQQLEVRLSTTGARPADPMLSCTVDLPTILGTPNAYVGFTGATGGGGNTHDIRQWVFVNTYAPIEGDSARALKQRAVNTLTDLLPNVSKNLAGRLAQAIRDIQDSLLNKLWVDDNHLTSLGDRVFAEECNAATKLQKILGTPSLDQAVAAAVQSAINDLVAADDILAQTAIADALGNLKPNGQRLANNAQQYRTAAQNFANVGQGSTAIMLYRLSWIKAQEAMGNKTK